MTYEIEPAGSSTRVLKWLVILTILLIAYWASNGGLDQIVVSETQETAFLRAVL